MAISMASRAIRSTPPRSPRELLQGVDGAFVNFEGVVRNNTKGRATLYLDYECYEAMAIKMMAQHRRRDRRRAPDRPHRHGAPPGPHGDRGNQRRRHRLLAPPQARLRRRARGHQPAEEDSCPIWKKEYFADGEVWVEGEWDDRLRDSMKLTRRAFLAGTGLGRLGAATADLPHRSKAGPAAGDGERRQGRAWWADLTREDFRITDNGAPQEVALFEQHTEQPLSVAIMLDISGSTAKDLKYEVDSLQRFAKALFGSGQPGGPGGAVHLQPRRDQGDQLHAPLEAPGRGYARPESGGRNLALRRDSFRRATNSATATAGASWSSSPTAATRHRQTNFHAALEAAHTQPTPSSTPCSSCRLTNNAGRNIGRRKRPAPIRRRHRRQGLPAHPGRGAGQGVRVHSPRPAHAVSTRLLPEERAANPQPIPHVKVETNGGIAVQTRSGYYGDPLR